MIDKKEFNAIKERLDAIENSVVFTVQALRSIGIEQEVIVTQQIEDMIENSTGETKKAYVELLKKINRS